MKLGIIILSRYSSSRFPGKALHIINKKTLLDHIIDNFRNILPEIKCVIATSTEDTDDLIWEHCKLKNIECFRGSLSDVSERILNCAISYNWDYFVRINGDNLFNDPDILKKVMGEIKITDYDFISNVQGRTFPYGVSVEIIKTSFYQKIRRNFNSEYHKEHVTSWLYENEKYGNRFMIKNKRFKNLIGVKLSIDTPEDIDIAEKIIEFNGGENYVPFQILDQFFSISR